jgi:hypothetical protein
MVALTNSNRAVWLQIYGIRRRAFLCDLHVLRKVSPLAASPILFREVRTVRELQRVKRIL